MESCESCRFWISHDNAKSAGITIPLVTQGLGICRRFPPAIFPNPRFTESGVADTAYPDTEPQEWCGEYQPIRDA